MKVESAEGAQFVRCFGPVVDALRKLGGSGTPSEVIERIVEMLKIPDSVQNELLDSGNPRFPNQVAWARYYVTREGQWRRILCSQQLKLGGLDGYYPSGG